MNADDVRYFSRVTELMNKMQAHERRVLDLALSLEDEFSGEEIRKISKCLFRLWEEVVHHNATQRKLEELEEERYNGKKEHSS